MKSAHIHQFTYIVPLPAVPRKFFAAGIFEILSMKFMWDRESGCGHRRAGFLRVSNPGSRKLRPRASKWGLNGVSPRYLNGVSPRYLTFSEWTEPTIQPRIRDELPPAFQGFNAPGADFPFLEILAGCAIAERLRRHPEIELHPTPLRMLTEQVQVVHLMVTALPFPTSV
jgi:hypothetical protein